jgi:hypothetical protein
MRAVGFLIVGVLFGGVPVLAQDAGEIAFWDSVRDAKSATELQAYLSAYPQGKFAPLARARLTALGAAAPGPTADPPSPVTAPARSLGATVPPAAPGTPTAAAAKGLSFAEQDFSGRNMRGQNLDGADFTGALLKSTDFNGATLRGAIFKEADLRGATVTKTDLSGADLRDALMPFFAHETNLSRANLEGLDLRSAATFQVNFNGANLRGTSGWADVTACTFRGADLRGANLVAARNVGGSETMNDIFSGAIYDATTRWPTTVSLDTLKAKRMD